MYPPLAAQAAELGIVVASQPGFLSSLGDGFAAAFPDSGDQLYSFASWQQAGITVAGSSDAPVITADPRIGIRDAIVRRTGDGRVLGPAERLTARDALALYTTQAAYACHREGEIGSLEPDKLGRLRRPGRESARDGTRADPGYRSPGHRPRRDPGLPIRDIFPGL